MAKRLLKMPCPLKELRLPVLVFTCLVIAFPFFRPTLFARPVRLASSSCLPHQAWFVRLDLPVLRVHSTCSSGKAVPRTPST
jgi:hypothetical protein